jgi:hypothetical protein
MRSRSSRRRVVRLAAGLFSVSLAIFAFSGLTTAHSPKPATISASVSSMTVTASGTWTWLSQANPSASKIDWTGYAIDWGDFNGNAVGTYNVGTATDNLVRQTATTGSSGSWGPLDHTYAAPGTYTICVIMYDLGNQTPIKTTGLQSTQAGGTGHNADNSVENQYVPPVKCMDVVIGAVETVVPTATLAPSATAVASATPVPSQSVEGVTSAPTATPPSTSSDPGSTGGSSDSTMPLLLLALSGILAMVALKPVRDARR